MNNKNKKTNDTAVRALEMLNAVFYKETTQSEILEKLNNTNKGEDILQPETLYKYISTFKLFGINIEKNNDKYHLKKSPFPIALDNAQIENFHILNLCSELILDKEGCTKIQNLIKKICLCTSNLSFSDIENNKAKTKLKYQKYFQFKHDKNSLNKYLKLCKEHQKISFTYNNKQLNSTQKFTAEPIEVVITPSGIILKAYNTLEAEVQNFYIDEISEIKQLPIMAKPNNVKSSVTFKLTGRLASAYELKQGERLTDLKTNTPDNYIVITNSEEDKDVLLKRLLRYGTACEIMYPKTYRNKAIKLIKQLRANYS